MTFLEIVHWTGEKIYNIRDAIMGSLVYAIYSHIYLGKDLFKNALEFFMGVVFAVYIAPVIYSHYPGFSENFLSFIVGLLGMKVMEVLLNTDWQKLSMRIFNELITYLSKMKK